ncbi:MAG TPA: chorismate-binding protein, partial [Pyrinomonadaceae bacterium]|nr:chorismate-binding protein [Pyrinomonadaceae bacterium]
TRPRGDGTDSDDALRKALRDSEKDRAENVMIVDLLRNDLGRICEFGSVEVERLCEIEEHPSVFHLVSTIHGKLRSDWRLSDVFRALFPCGSITGAPKFSTMKIIDAIESTPRGLSMGAIGYFARNGLFGNEPRPAVDTSVAIRTMVVRGNRAEFNVGGGIVIDSDADDEYLESLTKATALLDSLTKSV